MISLFAIEFSRKPPKLHTVKMSFLRLKNILDILFNIIV